MSKNKNMTVFEFALAAGVSRQAVHHQIKRKFMESKEIYSEARGRYLIFVPRSELAPYLKRKRRMK